VSTKKHILVTGSNRSGSTWVGKVLASNGKVDNIIEPLNPNRVQRFGKFELDLWYPKLSKEGSGQLQEKIYEIVSYYLNTSLLDPFSHFFTSYEGHSLPKSFRKRARRAMKPVKLLKDPTALFCVPFLVDRFEVKPVILIRHPAAYVLSIKEKQWWFDFNNLSAQDHFFSGRLAPLKEEVTQYQSNKEDRSIIENASLLWKIFYTQVLEYREQYPEWFYISHESLSVEPLAEFKKMFDYLELDFNKKVENHICKSTMADKGSEFVRDSRSNATKWQEKLSDPEKEMVRNITWGVAKEFYTSWE
jgi:hypothetical protein